MLKKNLSILVIVLLAMSMIAVVIWIYNKRIENIETNIKSHH